jgi:transposase
MASRENFKLPASFKSKRVFSEEFKCRKVQEIESGLSKVSEISKAYNVTRQAVYKWIYKYSNSMKKQERLIIESKSDTQKINQLKKQIAELERALGQKQIQLDFKDKMIELAEEVYQVDIKKKFGDTP